MINLKSLILALLLGAIMVSSVFAQGTAFTYQGQLYAGTNLASGKYDFQFALSNAPSGGLQTGPTLTNLGVGVTNGLFITTLDFGPVFTGQSNWLAISVRTNGGSGFIPLNPLQPITPTPYAVYAESANATNLIGTVQSASLSGVALLSGGNNFTGGSNTFAGSVGIGTTTPTSTLAVSGNIFFGTQRNNNVFNQIGDTIYLGAEQKYLGNTLLSAVGGSTDWINLMANPLSAGIMFGTSGFSTSNPHSNITALVVIKPNGNVGIGTSTPSTALQVNGTVTATSFSGDGSSLTGLNATNVTSGKVADALLSTNVALRSGGNTFGGNQSISGNLGLGIPATAMTLDISNSVGNQLELDGASVVGVRFHNPASLYDWDIINDNVGWSLSRHNVDYPFGILTNGAVAIGTGRAVTTGNLLEVGGNAKVDGTVTATGLQINGTATANALQVNGTATATTFAGSGSAVEFKVNGQRGLRLEYGNDSSAENFSANVIGGYASNSVASGVVGATIAGGGNYFNDGVGDMGSEPNQVLASFGTIGGGGLNTVGANGTFATVGGGAQNIANKQGATVGGGAGNTATGFQATVPGGNGNTAAGDNSFAAGTGAKANHDGAFVWADDTGSSFASTAANQFLIQASGGVGIGTNNPSAPLFVVGNPTGSTPATEGVIVGVQNGANTSGAALVGLSLVPSGNGIIGEADVAGGGGTPIGVVANSSAAGGVGLQANAGGANSFAAQFNGVCTFSGNVGIGTSAPSKGALEVDLTDGIQPGFNPVGLLSTSGAGKTSVSGGSGVSLWAAGSVFAGNFFAFSDERIKNIQGQSDGAADLQTLVGIQVTDYTYIDTIAKGNRPQKKVIAQQVEKVFPQAVSQSTNEVPDIYKRATIQDGWVQLATDLKVGERVKLIGDNEKGIYPVLELRAGAFRTGFKPATDKVFVYGREVGDFRTVDYDAIAMLNVSATQELARKVEAQKSELTALRAELAKLRDEKESLASTVSELKARDDVREDRLARLENALDKISAHGTYASLK